MGYVFNPLILLGLDASGSGGGGSTAYDGWKDPVANEAALPLVDNDAGDARVILSSNEIAVWDGAAWVIIPTAVSTRSLTNKTINADQNTITNIENADIKNGAAIDAQKIASGAVDNTEFGYLNGVTSPLQTQLNAKIETSEKGANNGVATLDGGGKIPVTQLPSSVMTYEGLWDASTNTPTLADGVGDAGMVYRVSVAGTQDLGSGSQTFALGDWVVYNGSIWQQSDNSDAVMSVNGQTGVVVLDTDDIAEGSNLYFTDERAQDAVGTILTDSSTIDFSYNDGSPSITAAVQPNSINNTHIATGAGIDAQKIGSGSVDDTELSYLNGVTSPIQAQFSGKQDTITGAATTITTANLTVDRALISNGSGKVAVSPVTSTELGYVSGVTSDIQDQLDNKEPAFAILPISKGGRNNGAPLNNNRFVISQSGAIIENSAVTADRVVVTNGSGLPIDSVTTATEVAFVSGVTSNIQTQLNAKASTVVGDLAEVSFSLTNNQSSPANVTGVAFTNGVTRSAELQYSIAIDATSDLYESGKIMAIQRGTDWVISQSPNGDNSQVLFDIDNSGQLTYTSANLSGFVSGTLKVRATTTSV